MATSNCFRIVAALVAVAALHTEVGAQGLLAPTVSPDPLPDVPPTSGGIPFALFDDYSWRSFIALNWPALPGPADRGMPDRARAFSDVTGPRVWETWKSRFEIFQPGGAAPSAWTSYVGSNPCGAGFANDVITLSSFTAFGDFNQAIFSLSDVGNPLIAQNQTYARYEVRANKAEFDSIVDNKWYIAANLPTPTAPVPFNDASTEVKAAWRILTASDTPAIRARYYVVTNAQVFDVAQAKCTLQDIALVGFHIVTKTPDRKQWIWSSFEHVDNVPGSSTEPTPPAGVPFSFNDPSQPQSLNPARRPSPISSTNPPVASPTPMQVVRKLKIVDSTMTTNEAYWALPEIKGTVWENYMLVMTQWPTTTDAEGPDNDGAPFPTGGSELANTTMETYFQFDGGSCMACHQISNAQGRDFVMFVTMDAFRPGTPAPADLFAAKAVSPSAATGAAPALEKDPMVEALSDFFEASQDK